MPNRVIRDGFLDSELVAGLSDAAECLFHRLLLAIDDAGRIENDLHILRSRLYPRGNRQVSQLEKALGKVISSGLVRAYEVGGKPYLQVMRWRQCGRSARSKCPGPDGSYLIQYATLDSREGQVNYVNTSLPKHAIHFPRDRLPAASCRPHADGVPTPYAPHADGIQASADTKTETKTETETKKRDSPSAAAPALSASPSAPPTRPLRPARVSAAVVKEAIERMEAAWHAVAGLPQIRRWSTSRRKALRTRLRDEVWLDQAIEAIGRIADGRCPFLVGQNDRGWTATIDWFLKPDSVTKILERQYDSKRRRSAELRAQRHPADARREW